LNRNSVILMKYIIVFIFSINTFLGFSQTNEVAINLPTENFRFFSDAIANNIGLYKVNSQVANEKKDLERANFLYDSLVNNVLKDTHFDNFVVNDFKSGRGIYMETFQKPIYLKTTTLWCEPNDSEIQALNDIAKEFGDVIDFIVLYWDERSKIEAAKKQYSSTINLVYVDELENYNSAIIHTLKHSLGIPTIILMDEQRKIIDINKGVSPVYTPKKETEYTAFGEFNPPTTKEHFINSYGVYFESMANDVNTILQNL